MILRALFQPKQFYDSLHTHTGLHSVAHTQAAGAIWGIQTGLADIIHGFKETHALIKRKLEANMTIYIAPKQ